MLQAKPKPNPNPNWRSAEEECFRLEKFQKEELNGIGKLESQIEAVKLGLGLGLGLEISDAGIQRLNPIESYQELEVDYATSVEALHEEVTNVAKKMEDEREDLRNPNPNPNPNWRMRERSFDPP